MNEYVESISLEIGVDPSIIWIAIGVIGILVLQALFKRRHETPVDRFRAPTSTTVKFGSSSVSSFNSDSSTPETRSSTFITVNGKEIPIDSEIAIRITDAIKGGNLIQAIKELRGASALSLVDSKQVVEVIKKELKDLSQK